MIDIQSHKIFFSIDPSLNSHVKEVVVPVWTELKVPYRQVAEK